MSYKFSNLHILIFANALCVIGLINAMDCSQKEVSSFKKEKAVILYSGGLDSSAVVAKFAAHGAKELHLILCDNGAQNHMDLAEVKLKEFRERFPETKFIFTVLKSSYLFKKIALKSLESDIENYKSNLLCVGCKMAMHANALLYAKEHGISVVADGFAKRQEDFPEQDVSFLEEMRFLYARHNVLYESPLYYIASSKNAVKDILSRYDLSTKSIEGGCLFGDTFSKPSTENVRAYFKSKVADVDQYIKEAISEKNIHE